MSSFINTLQFLQYDANVAANNFRKKSHGTIIYNLRHNFLRTYLLWLLVSRLAWLSCFLSEVKLSKASCWWPSCRCRPRSSEVAFGPGACVPTARKWLRGWTPSCGRSAGLWRRSSVAASLCRHRSKSDKRRFKLEERYLLFPCSGNSRNFVLSSLTIHELTDELLLRQGSFQQIVGCKKYLQKINVLAELLP